VFHDSTRTCQILSFKVKRPDAKLTAILELGVTLSAEEVLEATGVQVNALGRDFTREVRGPSKAGPYHKLILRGANRRRFDVESSLIHSPVLNVDKDGDEEDPDRYRLKFKVSTPLGEEAKAGVWFCVENLGQGVPVDFTEHEHQEPLPLDPVDKGPELPMDPASPELHKGGRKAQAGAE